MGLSLAPLSFFVAEKLISNKNSLSEKAACLCFFLRQFAWTKEFLSPDQLPCLRPHFHFLAGKCLHTADLFGTANLFLTSLPFLPFLHSFRTVSPSYPSPSLLPPLLTHTVYNTIYPYSHRHVFTLFYILHQYGWPILDVTRATSYTTSPSTFTKPQPQTRSNPSNNLLGHN